MIGTNAQTEEFSTVERGRELLDRGDVASAIECYGKVSDPDSLDELEARSMLIEARSHLSRKYVLEALESFEEALMMRTDGQRRQALDGISAIGEIRSQLGYLTMELRKGLRKLFGGKTPISHGISLVTDEENVVLVSPEALEGLPSTPSRSAGIRRLPPHLIDRA